MQVLRKAYHINTPLIYSLPLSNIISKPVYLKLDALQPSGSFKDRGMGSLLSYYAQNGSQLFITSSGGNAGLATATVANKMGIACHVVVPHSSTPTARAKIKAQNAHLTVHGKDWQEANELALDYCDKFAEKSPTYVHPFDHHLIWEGHSTVIDEIKQEFAEMECGQHSAADEYYLNGKPPSVILCAVGGGGLLNGVCIGLKNNEWHEATAVVTAETMGASSFYYSHQNGENITLDSIDTIATTLGARRVQDRCLEFTRSIKQCISTQVTDADTVFACKSFLNDHRLLVELSCCASLALLYNPEYHSVLDEFENVVVEVCGGSGINLQLLHQYMKQFNIDP